MNDSFNSTIAKIVVFFDICSSTKILEDLIRSENVAKWKEFLISQKNFLRRNRNKYKYSMYKFLGDGWILFFDIDVKGVDLCIFLKNICDTFLKDYKRNIKPLLSVAIEHEGITFGIDMGNLISMIMNGRTEYSGRALNIASRLQSSIAQKKETKPENKVLISNHTYKHLGNDISRKFKTYSVSRELKNISGGEKYLCKKICLFEMLEIT